MIVPTFKDLVTGQIAKATDKPLFNVYWWTEGNGSCDCNRAIVCGVYDEMEADLHHANPELLPHQSLCFGCKRFIAVDVEGDFEGMTKEDLIRAMNSDYPLEATRD